MVSWAYFLRSLCCLLTVPFPEDPAHDGEATVGEVWAYVELPMLMRNTNINQIISFYKQGRKFVTNIEWDATTVSLPKWPFVSLIHFD